jgi:hypothetical protein
MNDRRIWLLLALTAWLCVAVTACGSRGTDAVLVTATSAPLPPAEPRVAPTAGQATPLPSPQAIVTLPQDTATEVAVIIPADTSTPTPTLAPEPPSDGGMLEDLPQEVFVSLGGGDGAVCLEPPKGDVLPAAEGQARQYHLGVVCLWGFPAGKVVNVELHDPSGQFVAAQEVVVDQERDGIGLVEIWLSFAGLPTGDWTILADSAGKIVKAPIPVNEPDFPIISVAPPGSDPFDGSRKLWWWTHNSYTLGDNVAIFGAGFPPGRSLPLGIYYQKQADADIPAGLVYGQEAQADEQGRFAVLIPVETFSSQGDGDYYAIISLASSYWPSPGSLDPLGAVAGFIVTSNIGTPGSVTLELSIDGGSLVDPRVQQATVAAVNRLHLAERFGGAQVTFLFSFQGTVIDVTEEPWDPNLARQLLAEARYASHVPAEFLYPRGDSEVGSVAYRMAADLVQVGVPAEVVLVSPADMVGYVSKKLAAGEPVLWLSRR